MSFLNSSAVFALDYETKGIEYPTVVVFNEYYHTAPTIPGADGEAKIPRARIVMKRKDTFPFVSDSIDKNLLMTAIFDFEDACHPSRLNLHMGTQDAISSRINKFGILLGGDVKTHYDTYVAAHPADATWNGLIDFILDKVFKGPRVFSDMQRYLHTVKKPYKLSVSAMYTRLLQINRFTQYLPGNPTRGTAMLNDASFKQTFFNLMPNAWQLEFNKVGHNIYDDTTTIESVSRFMEVHEAASKSNSVQQSTPRTTPRRLRFGNSPLCARRFDQGVSNFAPYPVLPPGNPPPAAFSPGRVGFHSPPPISRVTPGSYGRGNSAPRHTPRGRGSPYRTPGPGSSGRSPFRLPRIGGRGGRGGNYSARPIPPNFDAQHADTNTSSLRSNRRYSRNTPVQYPTQTP